MSTNTPQPQNVAPSRNHTVRHSREDALTDLEFERLLDESYRLKPMQDLEARFVLLVCGRLGLRRGELVHMTAEWVDWRKRRIDIPGFEPCRKGRSGDQCAHCKQMAQQMADHNEAADYDTALARRWNPKTAMAERSVPFAFSGRVEIVLERYFDEFGQFMYTAQAANRRLNWLADRLDDVGRVTPHTLRATAASYHAGRGLNTLSLQALMGWAQPSTARDYIASNADNLDRQLQFAHQ